MGNQTSRNESEAANSRPHTHRSFSLKFAPHIGLLSTADGLFVHHTGTDPIDQIKFIADQGFLAFEDDFLKTRDKSVQNLMAREMARTGLELGSFVGTLVYDRPTFVMADGRERLLRELEETIEVAQRVNASIVTTLSGHHDLRQPRSYQLANMIDNMRFCAERAEKAGITLALEPIDAKGWPGFSVTTIADAYAIVRAVNSPAVRLLFDIFHVQVAEGDLIENIDRCWNEIVSFQIADNPGRMEPGTGEINYPNVLRHVHQKGFRGILGIEHAVSMPGKSGEERVLQIYRELDSTLRSMP